MCTLLFLVRLNSLWLWLRLLLFNSLWLRLVLLNSLWLWLRLLLLYLGDDRCDVVNDGVVGALAGHLLQVLGDACESVGHADVERRQVFDELGLVPGRGRGGGRGGGGGSMSGSVSVNIVSEVLVEVVVVVVVVVLNE